MATVELNDQTPQAATEDARVTAWRFEQLRQAGYDDVTAAGLAGRADIDLHLAVELARAGCPPKLALRILC